MVEDLRTDIEFEYVCNEDPGRNDEIMAGLLPTETKIKMDLVRQVQGQGISIILVEHVMQAIMGLCSRIIVLNFGQKIAEGTPQDISSNSAVIEAYLGRGKTRA